MKIFKDKELTQECEGGLIDFGIVKAGETKRIVLYVFNEDNSFLTDLEFEVEHKEIKVIEAPKELIYKGQDELILEWTATITLKEGLKTPIYVRGSELVG